MLSPSPPCLAPPAPSSRLLRLIPFLIYALLLVAMGLSRIFVLAHFPHQVVTGSLAGEGGPQPLPPPLQPLPSPSQCRPGLSLSPGVALGWGLQRWPPNFLKCHFFLGTALGLLLGALGLHGLATALGLDLDW